MIQIKEIKKIERTLDRSLREYNAKPRIYIFLVEESILGNLMFRRQRPHLLYKKEIVPKVLEFVNLPAGTKTKWSQKAGCSCGCSPGFIINTCDRYDIYVDIILTPQTV